jgi:hypothetical protein
LRFAFAFASLLDLLDFLDMSDERTYIMIK